MSNYFRSLSSLALFGSVAMVPASRGITLPAQTTIPVIFTHTENAAKAKAGDVVTAKTMQVVLLPNGNQLPKGSLVIGHIVEARPFKFDDTDYAVQQASYLSIKIDQVVDKSGPSPVVASVRAMADPISSQEARSPHGIDETDYLGTVTLIGGAHYSPIDKHVTVGAGRRHRGLQQEAGGLCASSSRRAELPGNPNRAIGGDILARRLRPLWFRFGSSI